MKYHDHIPKGIQVTEQTRICIKKHQRGDNSRSNMGELSFLYVTHCHDLFYITVKYHQNIPNGIQVVEQTWKCLQTDLRTDGQKTDGRQAHRYIPWTFQSGIKMVTTMSRSGQAGSTKLLTDREDQDMANSVDQDQTAWKQSDQGLHCLLKQAVQM